MDVWVTGHSIMHLPFKKKINSARVRRGSCSQVEQTDFDVQVEQGITHLSQAVWEPLG